MGMSNENLELVLAPLGDEALHSVVERKLAGVRAGAGVLDKHRVLSEEDVYEGGFEIYAFVLPQDVGVRVELEDLYRRVLIRCAVR